MEAKATRGLEHMLKGGVVNRATLAEIGVADKNDSAHTMMSGLRNYRYIPIISRRTDDGTCDYCMAPEEIKRYNNPDLRQQQREEMKTHVEEKRIHSAIEKFLNFLTRMRNSRQLRRHIKKIQAVTTEINALVELEQKQER